MVRLVVCVVALLVGVLAESPNSVLPQKPADNVILQRQVDLSLLFFHVHEPIHVPEHVKIANTWTVEKNIDKYSNVTAVKIFGELLDYGLLPRGAPFTTLEATHRFECETLFNVLFSAKDYETFWNTAVWMRQHVNEYLFVYILSVAIVHCPHTQGVVIPPLYEVFPEFFTNSEVLTTAQRVNSHHQKWTQHYPSTYLWQDNVVIRENMTFWSYYIGEESRVNYFIHDHALNALYYNLQLTYPSWLGGEVTPLVKDRRGEWFWFSHKQLLARYYLERLSNGLGEIPELSWDVPVETGFWSGLVYWNGIPTPVRPNNWLINQPEFVEELTRLKDFERRVRDAIDQGYIVNSIGEHINIRTPEAIDILGRTIQANVDSPNINYYGDFISIWKALLGNSIVHKKFNQLYNGNIPHVIPSALEQWQTAQRDPAFYLIWKRVLNIFKIWQEHLPLYRREEIALPSVTIRNVEVDKLVTYFENTIVNVTNHLYLTEHEATKVEDEVSVLVERVRLNHKKFQLRVNVSSESAKTVIIRTFLGPKHDSQGNEIPLDKNWHQFFLFNQFTHDLVQGENIIKRENCLYTTEDWHSGVEVYEKAEAALHGRGQWLLDQTRRLDGFPDRLILPKGRVGGMPFVLLVHISEYRAPKVPHGTGFDPTISLGLGTGARWMTDEPMGFPLNRPVYEWQIKDLTNWWQGEVLIHHKHTPEIYVPHFE